MNVDVYTMETLIPSLIVIGIITAPMLYGFYKLMTIKPKEDKK